MRIIFDHKRGPWEIETVDSYDRFEHHIGKRVEDVEPWVAPIFWTESHFWDDEQRAAHARLASCIPDMYEFLCHILLMAEDSPSQANPVVAKWAMKLFYKASSEKQWRSMNKCRKLRFQLGFPVDDDTFLKE